MPHIDSKTTRYLSAATTAIEKSRVDPKYFTAFCPECGELVSFDEDGAHIFLTIEAEPAEPPLEDQIVILVGCEGYFLIPPAEIGLGDSHPNWQDWTTGTVAIEVHGTTEQGKTYPQDAGTKTVDLDVVVHPGETQEQALNELVGDCKVTAFFVPGAVGGGGHPVVRISGPRDEVAALLLLNNYPLSEYGLA